MGSLWPKDLDLGEESVPCGFSGATSCCDHQIGPSAGLSLKDTFELKIRGNTDLRVVAGGFGYLRKIKYYVIVRRLLHANFAQKFNSLEEL